MSWFSAPEYWVGRLVLERGAAGSICWRSSPPPRNSAPSSANTACCPFRGLWRRSRFGARRASFTCAIPIGCSPRSPGSARRCRRPSSSGRPMRCRWGRDGDVVRAVGALSVDRQRRADLVLVRVGVVAPRDRVPDDLSRQPRRGAPGAHVVDGPIAVVPGRIRCGADQVARRSLLARPDMSVLPP